MGHTDTLIGDLQRENAALKAKVTGLKAFIKANDPERIRASAARIEKASDETIAVLQKKVSDLNTKLIALASTAYPLDNDIVQRVIGDVERGGFAASLVALCDLRDALQESEAEYAHKFVTMRKIARELWYALDRIHTNYSAQDALCVERAQELLEKHKALKPVECPACEGDGVIADGPHGYIKCAPCDGSGVKS